MWKALPCHAAMPWSLSLWTARCIRTTTIPKVVFTSTTWSSHWTTTGSFFSMFNYLTVQLNCWNKTFCCIPVLEKILCSFFSMFNYLTVQLNCWNKTFCCIPVLEKILCFSRKCRNANFFVRKQQIRTSWALSVIKNPHIFSVSKSQIINFWIDNLQIANPQIS